MSEAEPSLYRPVPKIPDRVALERHVLSRWDAAQVFAAVRDQTAGGEPYSFLDGPITANNPMGVHHAWGRTLKDVVQRYQAMNGRQLRWQNGFDCQGLWVEVEVEKALGFDTKRQIEAFGLDRFADACRERVAAYSQRIVEQSKRLGMWMDWERSYYTMSDTNISYIWTFLAECQRRGWLYQGHRLMPWCYRCGTSLSQHELTDAYDDVDHPSVYLRLPLDGPAGEAIAVWTTTPWTLPANVALAVNPEATYVLLRTADGDVWVAESRVASVPLAGDVVGRAPGARLVGRSYRVPVPGLDVQEGVAHVVVAWDEVSLEEGTGVVHLAPGCGAEDFEVARKVGLPVLSPIDEDGRYVEGYGWLTGRHVADVEADVVAALGAAGHLATAGRLTHRYPHCWRCSTPLVHRVVDEWFIACDDVRSPMRAAAAGVRWWPEHYGQRMQDWLANMGDWCISRKRYWGLPLPFFRCAQGHLTVVASKDDLRERCVRGWEGLRELHRPWIDGVTVRCSTCGAEATRVPEVGDCWLDAGVVAFSTLGWSRPDPSPGAQGAGAAAGLTVADLPDHAFWNRWYPAHAVCEMHEQIRLWFYSLLFMGVVLDGRPPYRQVLTYGRVNDADGREMHKSRGNAIWFDDAVDRLGADTMRWLYAAQPPGRDLNFGYHAGDEVARRFLTFWNAYAFFVTYANIARYQPSRSLLDDGPTAATSPLDRWLVARCHQLVDTCRAAYEALDTPRVTAAFDAFAEDLSNWFIRLSRERFWTEAGGTPAETAPTTAYGVLWYALVTAIRCVAPVMPFVTDHMWSNLVAGVVPDAPASVHLSGFPSREAGQGDAEAVTAMTEARRLAELGRMARETAGIRRRQPLARMIAVHQDDRARQRAAALADLVEQECNVRQLLVVDSAASFATTEVQPDFSRLGPKFKSAASAVGAALRAGDFTLEAAGYRVGQILVDAADVKLTVQAHPGYAVASGSGWTVGVDLSLTPQLVLEGRGRDLVRHIQQRRKDLDLPVTARVAVVVPHAAADIVGSLGPWVREQTLAVSLDVGPDLDVRAVGPDTGPGQSQR